MIHKYKLFDFFIALDVESGGVYVLDEISFDMLDFLDFEDTEKNLDFLVKKFGKYKKEDIVARYKEFHKLYTKGVIFSDCVSDKFKNSVEKSVIKAMCLHVAHDCNLRCKYCFASTGDFKQGRLLMPFETAKKAIDFLILNSGKRKNLEIDFFGGEPLLNFETIKKTVEYARNKEKKFNKNFRFTVTTNGMLLNEENMDFLNENMSNVVLSLDGRKAINDGMRVTQGGNGSYDVVLPKFLEFVSKRKGKDYFVRGTFTRYNLDFCEDFVFLKSVGFKNISIEPVVCDEKEDYSLKREYLPKIFEEYEKIAKILIEEKKIKSGVNFFHFNVDLTQGPCLIKRLRGCGCGCEYLAVSPEGGLYPCHQFVGEKNWCMGNLFDENFNENLKDDFSKVNVFSKNECKNCWAKYYCSGGCSANSYKYAGDIYKPCELSCSMTKKRIECAIAVEAAFLN